MKYPRDGSEYLAPSHLSVVYVESHDSERDSSVINQNESRAYKMAVAFMLAWGRGYPLILSSFTFSDIKDGPPADKNGNIMSPNPDKNNICKTERWVCQHRWRQIYNMVAFNRATHDLPVSSWWDNGGNQIAFSRGNKGFAAFNKERKPLKMSLKTNLPGGKYCDIISGMRIGGKCEGIMVEVNEQGYAEINVKEFNENDVMSSDGVLAILDHVRV